MSNTTTKDVSGEVDSDPMQGVKEIKGADAPMEPEVKIDITKHQDAADPDSIKNEPPATSPTATPVVNTSAPQKSNKGRNSVLVILLLLCFLCLLCLGITYALKDRLLQTLTNSVSRQDSTLTTVTEQEIQSSSEDLETLLEQKKTVGRVNSINGAYTISLTEEELLSSAFKNANGMDPSAVAIKFETNKAIIQIDIGKILASQGDSIKNSPELQNLPVDLSLLNGVILTADLSTNADGTKLAIENLTTGNPILDSLIPQDALNSIENQIDLNNIVSGDGVQTINIQKIEFLEGQMRLTLKD